MRIPWESIAQCLRCEIADYGGLLQSLEEQQRALFGRDAKAVAALAAEIEAQAGVVVQSHDRRKQTVADFAVEVGQPATSALRSLLSFIEPDARPLFEALIDEVNVLLRRVDRARRHNHTLLLRTVEIHQETLRQLRPQAFVKTYSPSGRVAMITAQASTALHVST